MSAHRLSSTAVRNQVRVRRLQARTGLWLGRRISSLYIGGYRRRRHRRH